VVDEYTTKIETCKMGDDLWAKFRKKMNATLKQCG